MPPRRRSQSPAARKAESPARAKQATPKAKAATPKSANTKRAAGSTPDKKRAKAASTAKKSNKSFLVSLQIYAACVSILGAILAFLFYVRPDSPAVCADVGAGMLLPPPIGSMSTESLKAFWGCASAYQKENYWFVLAFFEVAYIGLKMLAIPMAFALGLLSGALFPFPVCTILTGLGEAIGSSLCYLVSQAFLAPIIKHFFAEKLAVLQAKADENRQFMLSFNFFLRLTPFMPNWFINLACPLVGVPLQPFFIASLFGTQLSLGFLAMSGSTLKTASTEGFDLETVKGHLKMMAGLMAVLQCVPILLIRLQKQQQAATKKK